MKNLFKVILLCAILSNTFTPCFSEGISISLAEEISHLPLAVPAEISNYDNTETNPIKNTNSEEMAEVQNFSTNDSLPVAQSFMAENENVADASQNVEPEDNIKIAACPISNDILINRNGTVEYFKSAYKCLYGKELTAVILEKGRKFEVKSLHAMSYASTSGSEVEFESVYPERLFLSKEPSKLIFKGEVIKNKPPRKGGGSGTLKVQITGIKVENVTYPAEAYLSKMNKKNTRFGAVIGPSNYRDNLANTVSNGTINNYYNYNPCDKVNDDCVNNAVKPFYFLTGAALQTADLFFAPIIAFFSPGNEIFIPEGTEFEIKLEEDVPVLEL